MSKYEKVEELMKAENITAAAAARKLGLNAVRFYNWRTQKNKSKKANPQKRTKTKLSEVRYEINASSLKNDRIMIVIGSPDDAIKAARELLL